VRDRCVNVRVPGLENRRPFTGLVGSNPTLSAMKSKTYAEKLYTVFFPSCTSSCTFPGSPARNAFMRECRAYTCEAHRAQRRRFQGAEASRAATRSCKDAVGWFAPPIGAIQFETVSFRTER
jgi:hypothetical protein